MALNPALRIGVVLVVLMLASFVQAQRVSIENDGAYRPGVYAAIRIEAEARGLVRVRGPQMLGIDWDAPGRTSVIVPWMCWRTTAGDVEITVNDRKQTVSLRPVPATDPAPPAPWQLESRRIGPPDARYNESAYIPTYSWIPGQPRQIRYVLLLAGVFVVLVLCVVRLVLWRWRWSGAAVLAAGGALASGLTFHPGLRPGAVQTNVHVRSAEHAHQDIWTYWTSRSEQRADVIGSRLEVLIPRSAEHLAALDPVANVSAREDWRISVALKPGTYAAVLANSYPIRHGVFDEDRVRSGELIRQVYGQAFEFDADGVAILRPASSE